MDTIPSDTALRCVVRLGALFAASIDFLKDASVNFLVFAALEWNAVRRACVGMALAGILLVPGLATLWTAWDKLAFPRNY